MLDVGVDRFRRVRGRAWGYDPFAVDAFFARCDALEHGWYDAEPLTAEEVEQAEFPLVRRGYRIRTVDDELHRLALRLHRPSSPGPARGSISARLATAGASMELARGAAREAADIVVQLQRPAGARFEHAPVWGLPRGYDVRTVDEYLDRVLAALQSWPPSGLLAQETSTARFRAARHGYRADEVDALLDRVTGVLRASED